MSTDNPEPPTESSLREAAIAHLARYASTHTGLARVLVRRIDNWARRARRTGDRDQITDQATTAKALIDPIVTKLVAIGAIDDASYAKIRSRSLTRAGKSGRAVAATLSAKGVPAEITKQTLPPDPAREMGACLVAAKKRRLGPFSGTPGTEARNRELATLARAGFSERTSRELFKLTREEAEEQLQTWRDHQDS